MLPSMSFPRTGLMREAAFGVRYQPPVWPPPISHVTVVPKPAEPPKVYDWASEEEA